VAQLRNARATSAGGVVHRVGEGQEHEIVLVHRISPPLWVLPKGTPDAGETLAETALRETREETGLEVALGGELGAIRYFFVRGATRFNKTVHFFLMRPVGGSTDAHDSEFDEVGWFGIDEALALMTHRTEREVVERARELLERGTGAGSPAGREAAS
jgi:8-oxo-dGTP pyrophosphatase MutT (NUDIX family)